MKNIQSLLLILCLIVSVAVTECRKKHTHHHLNHKLHSRHLKSHGLPELDQQECIKKCEVHSKDNNDYCSAKDQSEFLSLQCGKFCYPSPDKKSCFIPESPKRMHQTGGQVVFTLEQCQTKCKIQSDECIGVDLNDQNSCMTQCVKNDSLDGCKNKDPSEASDSPSLQSQGSQEEASQGGEQEEVEKQQESNRMHQSKVVPDRDLVYYQESDEFQQKKQEEEFNYEDCARYVQKPFKASPTGYACVGKVFDNDNKLLTYSLNGFNVCGGVYHPNGFTEEGRYQVDNENRMVTLTRCIRNKECLFINWGGSIGERCTHRAMVECMGQKDNGGFGKEILSENVQCKKVSTQQDRKLRLPSTAAIRRTHRKKLRHHQHRH